MSREAALNLLSPEAVSPGLQAVADAPVESEAPKQEVAKPEAPSELDSTRFARLAKQEAELVKQKREIAAEKEKLKPIWEKIQSFEEKKKTNPIEAIKELGFSETDIFNFMAAQEHKDLTPEEKVAAAAKAASEQAIKEFKDEQKSAQEKIEQERNDKLIAKFKSEMTKAVESNKEKYEYCAYFGAEAQELAYEYVKQVVADSNGTDIPTAEEAMQAVEEHYEEQDKAMSVLKKRKPVEAPAAEAAKEETRIKTVTTPPGSTPPKPAVQRSRTLSNDATATTAAAALHKRNETRSEKKDRLANMLRNFGKS